MQPDRIGQLALGPARLASTYARAGRTNTHLGTPHSLMVPSREALAKIFPSGLNATLCTGPVCLAKVWRSAPLAARHKPIVSSSDPEARVSPDGLNATLCTEPVCPVSV